MNVANHQKYSLTALQLYAVVNVNKLRTEKSYKIFDNLFESINKLYNVGLHLNINGRLTRYYGLLAFCLGDTPALNWLGGFKESVSKTIKYCRTCEISNTDDLLNYNIVLRDIDIHKERLKTMKKSTLEQFKNYSKEYGINYSSLLLGLTNFDICKSMLQDPMHILYEGVCHLELKCLLNEVIQNKNLIDLRFLNECIKKFCYFDKDKSDKPNIIEVKEYRADGKFSQSSGQMSTLFQNLPLMIGEKLKNNENWNNFLRLLSIINITFSFVYDNKTVVDLRDEIKKYLSVFSELYPEIRMIPKMHFMTHFPDQLEKNGPLCFHSTLRFEGKNGQVKKYDFGNFINICKSVAFRQEFWMVSKRLDYNWDIRDNFLSKGEVFKNLNSNQIHDHGFSLNYNYDTSVESNSLRECDCVKIHGFLYKLNSYIIISDSIELKKKTVGKIERILLANDNLVFKLLICDIVEYTKQINCFKIVASDEITYRYYKNIVHKEPQNTIIINSDLYIQIRNFFHKLN